MPSSRFFMTPHLLCRSCPVDSGEGTASWNPCGSSAFSIRKDLFNVHCPIQQIMHAFRKGEKTCSGTWCL